MDIVEYLVVPEVPRVIDNEQLMVYVPLVGPNGPGIAEYDSDYFVVEDGTVSLQPTITLDKLTVDTLKVNTVESDLGLLFSKVVNGETKGKFGFEDSKLVMYLGSDFNNSQSSGLQVTDDGIDIKINGIDYALRENGYNFRTANDYGISVSDGMNVGIYFGTAGSALFGRDGINFSTSVNNDKRERLVINNSESKLSSYCFYYYNDGDATTNINTLTLREQDFIISSNFGDGIDDFNYLKINFSMADNNGCFDSDYEVRLQGRSGANLEFATNGEVWLRSTKGLYVEGKSFARIGVSNAANLYISETMSKLLNFDTYGIKINSAEVKLGQVWNDYYGYISIDNMSGVIKLSGPNGDNKLSITNGKLITSKPLYLNNDPYVVDNLSVAPTNGSNRALSADQGYLLKQKINDVDEYSPNVLYLTLDPNTYKLKATLQALKTIDGVQYNHELSTFEVDLPLETMVINGSYDNTTKDLTLTLKNGNEINIPIDNIVDGLVSTDTMNTELDKKLSLTGDTMTGDLGFDDSLSTKSIIWRHGAGYGAHRLYVNKSGDQAFHFQYCSDFAEFSYKDVMVIRSNGEVIADKFTGTFNGNANTATKLETARNINGIPFDGTSDINIVFDVATQEKDGLMSAEDKVKVDNALQTTGGTITGSLDVTDTLTSNKVVIGNAVTLEYDATNKCLNFNFSEAAI